MSLTTWLISRSILWIFLSILDFQISKIYQLMISHAQISCHETKPSLLKCSWLATFSPLSVWWLCTPNENLSKGLNGNIFIFKTLDPLCYSISENVLLTSISLSLSLSLSLLLSHSLSLSIYIYIYVYISVYI